MLLQITVVSLLILNLGPVSPNAIMQDHTSSRLHIKLRNNLVWVAYQLSSLFKATGQSTDLLGADDRYSPWKRKIQSSWKAGGSWLDNTLSPQTRRNRDEQSLLLHLNEHKHTKSIQGLWIQYSNWLNLAPLSLTTQRLRVQIQRTELCSTYGSISACADSAVVQATHLFPSACVPTRWYRWGCAAWSGCRHYPSRTWDSPRGNGRSPLNPSCGWRNWGWRCVLGPNA